jgi:hypothetical protein
MKYRIAYAIALVVSWVDVTLLVHGERFQRVPFIWRIPSCEWSARLHEWAAEQCCEHGCERCYEDFALTKDEIMDKYGPMSQASWEVFFNHD